MKNNCLTPDYTKSLKGSDIKIHPDLLSSMSYCLVKSGQLMRVKMDEILSEYNLINPHVGILIIILNSERINQLNLGEQLGIDKATMVKLIDDLEKQGFVERVTDKNDRRSKLIQITKTGKTFTSKMSKMRTKIEDEFLSTFTDNEKKQIRELLPLILIAFYNHANKE